MLSEVYGDRMVSGSGSEGESFPLQQKLLVCCLLLLTRSGKSREIPLGKVRPAHTRCGGAMMAFMSHSMRTDMAVNGFTRLDILRGLYGRQIRMVDLSIGKD